ncbi:hypothetical protein P7K49_025093 [Saguinus oedipus]|uniref:Sorting nexin protein WASP-binding domain-containing protein n=1 Tax=Saguinus oedipus TaxID=9490 RepID=A0ABQ9UG42_SAGOE|nr:hypothetical protein P7K49_025093 [Saguinus oedipus]
MHQNSYSTVGFLGAKRQTTGHLEEDFMSNTEETAWRQGKKKAEKDEMVSASFFLTLSPPPGWPSTFRSGTARLMTWSASPRRWTTGHSAQLHSQ